VRFWDSSALVPLLVSEAGTKTATDLYAEDASIVVFWTTVVECASAIARADREGWIDPEQVARAIDRLDRLQGSWSEVQPVDLVRETARRLLRTHPLRTADSLQLAAALVVSEFRPASLDFVCLDGRLRDGAAREGLPVRPA
jgi:predicted nucleic acid-binding protein